MSKNFRYMDSKNWHEIKRATVFDAAMLFNSKRPLRFFIPNAPGSIEGKVQEMDGEFKPNFINGKAVAPECDIVITLKPRKVVILSNDAINQATDYEYIQVAPIFTIKADDKKKPWYGKMKQDDHPAFVYLPNGNLERYVDISQMVSIHKNLLLHLKETVQAQRMSVIEDSILQCLDLGLIEESDEKASNE